MFFLTKVAFRMFVAGFLFVNFFTNVAFAEPQVMAACGASTGYAAHIRSGLFATKGDAELIEKDGFSDSKLGLMIEKKGDQFEFDIVFINRGVPYRDSDQGDVRLIKYDPKNETFLLLTVTEKTVRTYMFNLSKNSKRNVIWTDTEMGLSPRSRLMVAGCE